MLVAYAVAAGRTAGRQSPTNDEPFHMASAVAITRLGDFRINPDDPPLIKRLVGLATSGVPADIDTQSPAWKQLATDLSAGRLWSSQYLYTAPGVDVDGLFHRARIVMIGITLLCAGMIAAVAYRLAGPVAAVVGTAAFLAHPLVLAHGPLLKGDLPFAVVMFALAIATAWLLQKVTWPRAALAGAICGVGLLVKLSAVLLPGMLAVALVLRAMMASDWPVQKWIATSRRLRLASACGVIGIAAVVAYGVLWSGYGFRYRATDDGPMNLQRSLASLAVAERMSADPNASPMTDAEFAAWRPPLTVRPLLWANEHRLLPEAWVNGVVFLRSLLMAWPHYFCGEVETHGSILYFPAALAMKSPLSWLAGLAACLVLIRRRAGVSPWMLAAGVVVLMYGIAALLTNMQEGVRHLLPLFPFAAVVMGLAAARAWQKRVGQLAVAALAAMLLVETAMSGGDYLAYFNAVAGGKTGGAKLLGDSNLDWGQGLPSLAAWQQQNPDVRLYLCYSGAADPAHYGIRYINLPGGTPLGPKPQQVGAPGVIAISVTTLQGTYATPDFDPSKMYAPLTKLPLLDPLDGSIHLYLWNPKPR